MENNKINFQKFLAKNKFISKEIQLILVNSKRVFVRSRLASNSLIDKEIQLLLLEKYSHYVRLALSRNTSINKSIQIILFEDGKDDILHWLYNNPSVCLYLKEKIENYYEVLS